MNLKILISPQRYIQGPGALRQIVVQLGNFNITNPLVLASPSALKACGEKITSELKASGLRHALIEFRRECTLAEIYRIRDVCLAGQHDAIISCGGGKTLDAGRAAAAGYALKTGTSGLEIIDPLGADVACVQIPTVAATNAATASLSVFYNAQGIEEGALLMRKNPVLILVDTTVLQRAPVRTLVAGMGDALSIFFEADISQKTSTPGITGALATETGLMMSRLTFDLLMKHGREARREAESGVAGPAFEAVVEAIILSSGVGYENTGLSASHAIAGSLTLLHDQYDPVPYHGELVAFCTLCQLIMENREKEHVDRVFSFCQEVGLPTTFKDLGLKKTDEKMLKLVAQKAAKSFIIRSMPEAYGKPDHEGNFYNPDDILRCLRETDVRGQVLAK